MTVVSEDARDSKCHSTQMSLQQMQNYKQEKGKMGTKCPRCGEDLASSRKTLLTSKDLPFIFVIAAAFLFFTFKGTVFIPDTGSNQVTAVEKSWWGLVKKERTLKYFRAPGYEYAAWNAKNDKGEWFLYLTNYDGPEPTTPDPVP